MTSRLLHGPFHKKLSPSIKSPTHFFFFPFFTKMKGASTSVEAVSLSSTGSAMASIAASSRSAGLLSSAVSSPMVCLTSFKN